MFKKNTTKELYNFINPTSNDQISKMNGLDLQELFYYLDNYYLELRKSLGITSKITFGLEIECEHSNNKKIEKEMNKEKELHDNWRIKSDGSLENGIEIISPILIDNQKNWNSLDKMCTILNKHAIIGKKAGGHIHIGAHIFGSKTEPWMNFIKLWSVYENIIFRFLYGEFLNERESLIGFATPTTNIFWNDYQKLIKDDELEINKLIKNISHKRYQAVNFNNIKTNIINVKSYKNTIEFRCPNGTLESVIWQNNVNLLANLLLHSKSSMYQEDIINQRKIINEDRYSDIKWYNEIYLDQALELCDILFNNNLDKIYFLRQYLKSFETSSKKLKKAKTFIKKRN